MNATEEKQKSAEQKLLEIEAIASKLLSHIDRKFSRAMDIREVLGVRGSKLFEDLIELCAPCDSEESETK